MKTKISHLFGQMLLATIALSSLSSIASAAELRIARQTGLPFLPIVIMIDQKILEKHAAEQGIPDLKVEEFSLTGGTSQNEALLSGSIDIAVSGIPSVIVPWDRTGGKVIGLAPLSAGPMFLNTSDDKIRSLKDFDGTSKIAVPAPKISIQAILLQMASEKEFGDPYRLDPFMVPLNHPEAAAALIGNKTEVKTHFATMPFHYYEMESKKIHTILSSNDIVGGLQTMSVAFTTTAWYENNKPLYHVFLAALDEANEMINKDPEQAAKIYARVMNWKGGPDEIYRMITDKSVLVYDGIPRRLFPVIDFMHRIGSIKRQANSWKDLFVPEIHNREGS
ncbi:MAG: ABC transporter substrate-binding protein [Pusillimonas sp.]